MNPLDQDQVLKELLAPDDSTALRQRSLKQGLVALRRERRKRQVMRSSVLLSLPLLLVVVATFLDHSLSPSQKTNLSTTAAIPAPPVPDRNSKVKFISDEELFALFPGRSMVLVGEPGHQHLVFLGEPPARSQSRS